MIQIVLSVYLVFDRSEEFIPLFFYALFAATFGEAIQIVWNFLAMSKGLRQSSYGGMLVSMILTLVCGRSLITFDRVLMYPILIVAAMIFYLQNSLCRFVDKFLSVFVKIAIVAVALLLIYQSQIRIVHCIELSKVHIRDILTIDREFMMRAAILFVFSDAVMLAAS
jgi:hypothetical protein